MAKTVRVNIYGDSLMRGTVMDENGRYHTLMAQHLQRLSEEYDIEFNNRARFGITAEKGLRLVEKDIAKGLDCQYAVIEFGGNDCSFDWERVAQTPDAPHDPFTQPQRFGKLMAAMAGKLAAAGVVPILVTLPPISAEKHLNHIGKTEQERGGILRWLGDVQVIYHFHELYSKTVERIACQTGALLMDVRSRFLPNHSWHTMIGPDGVHLTKEGYGFYAAAFADFIAAHRREPGRQVFA